MLLADMAQVAEGKLYIMGAGWSVTGPDPMPSAVVLKLDIDRHETDFLHYWELFLEDADGKPVYQGIDTSFLVATLVKAIQEQQDQINDLQSKLITLTR